MFQNILNDHMYKFISFLNFAKSFLIKRNPIKAFFLQFQAGLKEFLTLNKKLKMARYRLNYQKYRLSQMEKLIAQSNEHVFLRGKTLNETR